MQGGSFLPKDRLHKTSYTLTNSSIRKTRNQLHSINNVLVFAVCVATKQNLTAHEIKIFKYIPM